MQTQVMVAEQTSRSRYWQPAPLPTREIELTIRLRIPDDDGADVGIRPSVVPDLPEPWQDLLLQRLFDGVHACLARVGTALSVGGVGVEVTRLRLSPPPTAAGDPDDLRRMGETLEGLAASVVAALWTGLISLAAPAVP